MRNKLVAGVVGLLSVFGATASQAAIDTNDLVGGFQAVDSMFDENAPGVISVALGIYSIVITIMLLKRVFRKLM